MTAPSARREMATAPAAPMGAGAVKRARAVKAARAARGGGMAEPVQVLPKVQVRSSRLRPTAWARWVAGLEDRARERLYVMQRLQRRPKVALDRIVDAGQGLGEDELVQVVARLLPAALRLLPEGNGRHAKTSSSRFGMRGFTEFASRRRTDHQRQRQRASRR